MSETDINFDAALDKVSKMTTNTSASETADTTKPAVDTETEAKLTRLAELEKAEAERVSAAELAKKEEYDRRISEVEAARVADKTAYDEKLEKLSVRMSSPAQGTDSKPALSREDYLADQEKYDRMFIKDLLEKGK